MRTVRYRRETYNPVAACFRRRARLYYQAGLQLLELLIALAVISVMAMVAIPSYSKYRDRVDMAKAVSDIVVIGQAIERYYTENNHYPDSLAEAGMGGLKDPWEHPYQYLRLNGATGKIKPRKDKSLHPINTDYDLCSMGKDGDTKDPLTAKASQDDIIRANNGQYIGLAADY